ncbi:MAG: hypothetical protein ACT4ON_13020 [Bacteroidota bacterium]
MFENKEKQLEQHLLNISNILRDKIITFEFRDDMLKIFFHKYLSENMLIYANRILKDEEILYQNLVEGTIHGEAYIQIIKKDSLKNLGYFLKPCELFREGNPELMNIIKKYIDGMPENLQ